MPHQYICNMNCNFKRGKNLKSVNRLVVFHSLRCSVQRFDQQLSRSLTWLITIFLEHNFLTFGMNMITKLHIFSLSFLSLSPSLFPFDRTLSLKVWVSLITDIKHSLWCIKKSIIFTRQFMIRHQMKGVTEESSSASITILIHAACLIQEFCNFNLISLAVISGIESAIPIHLQLILTEFLQSTQLEILKLNRNEIPPKMM